MNKKLLFLTVLFASSFLGAQDTNLLGREEVLNAFKQYNPVALQKATMSQEYNDLLNKLAMAYSAVKTDENEIELIALVKNFDNSIILQGIKQDYANGRTLQMASGTDLKSLEEKTQNRIADLVEDIYKNTLDVKKIQIERYKQNIKEVKKDKNISAAQKKVLVAGFQNKIKQVKAEVKTYKKDHKQKIQDTAKVYFVEVKSFYESQQEKVVSSQAQPKSNPQKTAAQ